MVNTKLISFLLAAGVTPDETFNDEPLSIGAEVVRPFGGKLNKRNTENAQRQLDGLMVGQDTGGGMGGGGAEQNVLFGILRQLGGNACKVWGEPMPVSRGECVHRLCLTQLFYGVSVGASATAQSYTLFARDWFLPVAWVDFSATTVTITNITFKANPIFESPAGTVITPSSAFAPASNWNFVIGIPAISSTNGYVMTLANSAGTAAALSGKLVGVGVRSA